MVKSSPSSSGVLLRHCVLNALPAKRLLRKVINTSHTIEPSVITADKNAAYSPAVVDLIANEALGDNNETQQSKYLNNAVAQDHRFIKRRVQLGLGLAHLIRPRHTIKGYEAMNRVRKEQIKDADRGKVMGQISLINEILGVADLIAA